jgi:hypothetical protein
LALTIDGPDPLLSDELARLTADLTSTVSGYACLQITIVHTGQPVTLTVLHDDEVEQGADERGDGGEGSGRPVTTSVGVRLSSMSAGFDLGSRAVIFGRTRGALVDLAADLAFALDARADRQPGDRGGGHAVDLDADLPLIAERTELTGLAELATLHRAIGLLIDQGQHPDAAADTLVSRAGTTGLTPHAYAVHLLRA